MAKIIKYKLSIIPVVIWISLTLIVALVIRDVFISHIKLNIAITPKFAASPTNIPDIIRRVSITPEPSINIGSNTLKTQWTHHSLPTFSFWIPEGWTIEVKEFGKKDTLNFKTHYFAECSEYCMGIRLSKSNNNVEFIFNRAMDDSGSACYDITSIEYLRINNSWYQINNFHEPSIDNSSYMYTQNFTLERRITTNKLGDQDIVDQACISGGLMFLNLKHVDYENIPYHDGGIGLEFPRLYGNPDEKILQEIWQIINSISGPERHL